MVMADTVARPGGDAAIVRIHGSNRGLALTTDCTPRYCGADAATGAAQAVAEAWRNLTAVGARPLAITDNMNFGNPERPEIMGQFADAVDGIRDACLALDFPVVSGNVSFYNETNGKGILPTPAIGAVGLIDDLGRTARLALAAEGQSLALIGATAHRHRWTWPLSAATATSSGLKSPPDGLASVTTFQTAGFWWRRRKWPWRAASAAPLTSLIALAPTIPAPTAPIPKTPWPPMPGFSAKTRGAISWPPMTPKALWNAPKRPKCRWR
jgi:hypothetical protein